ncbi:MAG: cation transporter [Hyphomicrobiales bacterium]
MKNQADKIDLTPEERAKIERRSLNLSMWLNAVMGISGIVAATASRSDALLVDGLYSAVNFGAAIVAIFVGRSIARAPDRSRPFGYDADEAIYVVFRSLTLLGIISFAALSALVKIITYAQGGDVPELVFGPIVIYMVSMVIICGFLTFWHRYNWKKAGKQSDILVTESRAALVDGVISAGAGGALVSVPLLSGTALEGLIPIADAIVVLTMVIVIFYQPTSTFLAGLSEIAGHSMSAPLYKSAYAIVKKIADENKLELIDIAATKLGRGHMIVAYVDPGRDVSSEDIDAANEELTKRAVAAFTNARTEIVITKTKRQQRRITENRAA